MSPRLFKRLSDESLGSRLASGEAAAFDELYRRYSNRLAAYGSHLLGDAASGDDVAQATMMKAYAALREGRLPERMKPWLYRIAHNTAIDLVVRRRELPSDDLPESPSADREPFAGALIEALAMLPDRQRRVYALREVHGLRIDETAAELGLTAPQVEQALFAARNRLAELLVFGDRLNCVTVQRLAAGPLDGPERRALKTHVRACADCRQTLGLRGRALTVFPGAAGFEWLRGLGAGLIGGGAPAAAKVGALFATATVAAGVPVAVEHATRQHAHRATLPVAATKTAVPRVAARTPKSSGAVEVVALTPARSRAAVPLHRSSSQRDETQASGDRHDGSKQADGTGVNAGRGSKSGDSAGDGSADSHSSVARSSGGDSGDTASSHGVSGTSGDSSEGSSGARTRHGGSGPTESSTGQGRSETKSSAGSTSGDGSKSGSGDRSDDHSDESTTSTPLPPLPPPPAVQTVTVTTGD